MLSGVKSLLLHNLVSVHLRRLRVTFFLVIEGSSCARTFHFLFYDEIRLSCKHQTVLTLKRVFADVFQNFFPRILLFLPFSDVVTRLLLLESFQNELIFSGNLGKFSFPGLSIEWSATASYCSCWHKWLNGHFCPCLAHEVRSLLDTPTAIKGSSSGYASRRVSCVESSSLLLKDIGHLF